MGGKTMMIEAAPDLVELSLAAVADRVQKLLDDAPITPAYRSALSQALLAPGNILSDAPKARWARLVWVCCAAAGDKRPEVVTVAAAVELFMTALDLLDDVEDGEANPLQAALGQGPMLNVSTGLLFLTNASLLGLAHGAEAARILTEASLVACSGQHADLQTYTDRSLQLDESLMVTEQKSAALVSAICHLGAFCGGADESGRWLYARFGSCLGMVVQLTDDIADIHPHAQDKTDIALGRPTLPLTYAMLHEPIRSDDPSIQGRDLWRGGPAYLTWAVAEVYRRRALELIPRLTSDPARQVALAELLPTLA